MTYGVIFDKVSLSAEGHADEGAPAPETVAVPDSPVRACRCGAGPHATDSRRCAAGHPLRGVQLAVQHALRTDRLPPEFAHLEAEVADYVQASIADDGGESEVPARRRSLHSYRARVHRRILQLDAAIEVRGLFDKRGKLRVAWLQQLQSLINTAKGIDSLLGLARRARNLNAATPEAALAEMQRRGGA